MDVPKQSKPLVIWNGGSTSNILWTIRGKKILLIRGKKILLCAWRCEKENSEKKTDYQ